MIRWTKGMTVPERGPSLRDWWALVRLTWRYRVRRTR